MIKIYCVLLSFLLLMTSCNVKNKYGDLSTFSKKNNLHAVVKVSAGTNKYFEYDYEANVFKVPSKNGVENLVEYAPVPFNICFIPSTQIEKNKFSPVEAILLAESLTPTTLVETKAIAGLKIKEAGKEKNIVITIPAEKHLQVIKANNLSELTQKYPALTDLIKNWYENFDKRKQIEFITFEDENFARNQIETSKLKYN